MDRPIEVLVVESVLVMVNTGRRIGDFVTHKPDAIVSRIRFDLVYCSFHPSRDGRLPAHRRTNRRK